MYCIADSIDGHFFVKSVHFDGGDAVVRHSQNVIFAIVGDDRIGGMTILKGAYLLSDFLFTQAMRYVLNWYDHRNASSTARAPLGHSASTLFHHEGNAKYPSTRSVFIVR